MRSAMLILALPLFWFVLQTPPPFKIILLLALVLLLPVFSYKVMNHPRYFNVTMYLKKGKS